MAYVPVTSYAPHTFGTIVDGGVFADGSAHLASSNGFSTLAGLQAIFHAASFTATGSSTNLTVTSVTGILYPGLTLGITTGISAGITIISQTSGTTGGAGVYVTSSATTISAAAATASWASATSNDMAGLMIQAAVHAATMAGGGEVHLPSGSYRNLPSGIIIPANSNATLTGDGSTSILLCANCGTNPGISVFQQQNTVRKPVRRISLWGLNSFTFGSLTGGGTANTNTYNAGSVGMYFSQNVQVVFEQVSFINFDQAHTWDTAVGGNVAITFRDCSYQYNNKGVVIPISAPNSFEKMMWDGCQIAGNNYGVYIVFQNNAAQGSGTAIAADAYFHNCSMDYNVVMSVYYIGAGYNDAFMNSLYFNMCHFETSTTASGTAPRIQHDGNLTLCMCEGFENAGNPLGWIEPLSFGAVTSVNFCKSPGNGFGGSQTPIIYGNTTLSASGVGNTNIAFTDTVFLGSSNGMTAGFRVSDPQWWTISGNTTLGPYQQAAPSAIPVTATANITVAMETSLFNMILGTVLTFITAPGVTATFVAASGVTIATSGAGLTFGGTTAKNVTLMKIGTNHWSASGQMT